MPQGDIRPWDLDSWKAFEQVGRRHPRMEAPLKVTGRAKYTYDVKLPGMLYGRMIGAAIPAGEIVAIDTSAAEALPGVKAVWTADQRVVRFAGQDVAAVAAVSPEIAEDAARLVKVTYKERPFAHELREAMKDGAPVVFGDAETPGGQGRAAQGQRRRPDERPARRRPRRRRARLRRGRGDDRGHLLLPRAHALAARDPRRRRLLGGRAAHRLRLDAGDLRRARGPLRGAEARPQERARDLRAHGRRLRQQARPVGDRQRDRDDRLQAGEAGRRARSS